jgi:hypothetical protein
MKPLNSVVWSAAAGSFSYDQSKQRKDDTRKLKESNLSQIIDYRDCQNCVNPQSASAAQASASSGLLPVG